MIVLASFSIGTGGIVLASNLVKAGGVVLASLLVGVLVSFSHPSLAWSVKSPPTLLPSFCSAFPLVGGIRAGCI